MSARVNGRAISCCCTNWRRGAADRSYGLSVAKLAGVPGPVIKHAKAVLDRLEKGREQTGGLGAGLGDLPLFAATLQAEEEEGDALREAIEAIDVDALSPREALDTLYALQAKARATDANPARPIPGRWKTACLPD